MSKVIPVIFALLLGFAIIGLISIGFLAMITDPNPKGQFGGFMIMISGSLIFYANIEMLKIGLNLEELYAIQDGARK